DFRHIGVVLEKDGEVVATAATAAVLGNPIHSVVNLVNKLAEFDIGLSAGEFVIPGTAHAVETPVAGSCYRATFDRVGYVSTRFVD
ncbi:MAG: 2-keto-4-pentenoate hydratase, partial [Candidatus Poribacteria bacterium]|nr:2-keto-4-pentenoate hydratase [Candidatus Poribacteria bacterium]